MQMWLRNCHRKPPRTNRAPSISGCATPMGAFDACADHLPRRMENAERARFSKFCWKTQRAFTIQKASRQRSDHDRADDGFRGRGPLLQESRPCFHRTESSCQADVLREMPRRAGPGWSYGLRPVLQKNTRIFPIGLKSRSLPGPMLPLRFMPLPSHDKQVAEQPQVRRPRPRRRCHRTVRGCT